MAESRKHILHKQLDLDEILPEAEHRWFRPPEVCKILRNYQKFDLTPIPPIRPPAGSLLLFDRKVVRYFRKDGHQWKKRKDGNTVRESHERLKAGPVDILNCYYAHGEDNVNFQRRCYWMLDEKFQHIVLVHYREVKQGYKAAISHFPAGPVPLVGSPLSISARDSSSLSLVQEPYASSANRVDYYGGALSSEYDNMDSASGHQTTLHTEPLSSQGFSQLSSNPCNLWSSSLPSFYPASLAPSWPLNQNSRRDSISIHDTNLHVEGSDEGSLADFFDHKLSNARFDPDSAMRNAMTSGNRLINEMHIQSVIGVSKSVNQVQKEDDLNSDCIQFNNLFDHPVLEASTVIVDKQHNNGSTYSCDLEQFESGELKKLDSFGRWMAKEIGGNCDDCLMTSDSGNYWDTLDPHNYDKVVSSLHMQLDVDLLGPSLSQEQLFSILDFSPDWIFSGSETKVLIVGTFLGSKKLATETKWGCMFGEIEVSAKVLTDNVIYCQAPFHPPSRVPFYVTCSNRLACSEVREFEYRENPILGARMMPEDEVCLQLRLLKLVDLKPNKVWFNCSISQCEKCKLKETIYLTREGSGICQDALKINVSDHVSHRDVLVQKLLRDKLLQWLVVKIHEEGKGPNVLDNEGQGVIHLAASLGYAWAMGPIVDAGVNPNFRDACGRTGLHWASYFGREETVIALIKLGGAPGAVEDPTSAFPQGRTAADLASSRGHKGIAAYLAEANLTSHLWTVNENEIDIIAANKASDSAFEIALADSSNVTMHEQRFLKESLVVLQKSTHAATLIQAAFKARSFRRRQLVNYTSDIPEIALNLVVVGSLNKVHRMSHLEVHLHSAALKIQKRYRRWKGRREVLKIRNRIVKIQAHVRGQQARDKYKQVVWSVSIVEKAILRWRRRRPGLRGFRGEQTFGIMASSVDKSDEYEFLSIGRKQKYDDVSKALARVKSMVYHPEARDQYMRLVMKFEDLKIGDGEAVSRTSIQQ
ncbi:hypothetical protein QN277_006246 [Acacia crassicarpa]|uniref:CG-1 domain-containing protein n=1 Tax=Acacia crassicarpa TaxID=499986 RepID=A0AAE1M7M4_9FABA|nr:hypothetical protein QN277_006246 [Acacia crassicarpa]